MSINIQLKECPGVKIGRLKKPRKNCRCRIDGYCNEWPYLIKNRYHLCIKENPDKNVFAFRFLCVLEKKVLTVGYVICITPQPNEVILKLVNKDTEGSVNISIKPREANKLAKELKISARSARKMKRVQNSEKGE